MTNTPSTTTATNAAQEGGTGRGRGARLPAVVLGGAVAVIAVAAVSGPPLDGPVRLAGQAGGASFPPGQSIENGGFLYGGA